MNRVDEIDNLNKYGLLRLDFLKNYNKGKYTELLMTGELTNHLSIIQDLAKKRVDEIIETLKKQNNLTEEIKQKNQLYWVGMMNSFKSQAEEIVLKEIIYNDAIKSD